jgi:hypothetical protein
METWIPNFVDLVLSTAVSRFGPIWFNFVDLLGSIRSTSLIEFDLQLRPSGLIDIWSFLLLGLGRLVSIYLMTA